MTTAVLMVWWMERSRMFSFSLVMMSRDENGSSRISRSGSVTRARASSTRFFIPPESSDGAAVSLPKRPSWSSIFTPLSRRCGVMGSPRTSKGSRTLLRALRHGSRVSF